MLHDPDNLVAKAATSKVPRDTMRIAEAPTDRPLIAQSLDRLADLERAYDGPIPPALRFDRNPIITAYGAVQYARSLVRQQIEAIRKLEANPHPIAEHHGKWMARLYADLRVYRRIYRLRFGELIAQLRAAEGRQFACAAE